MQASSQKSRKRTTRTTRAYDREAANQTRTSGWFEAWFNPHIYLEELGIGDGKEVHKRWVADIVRLQEKGWTPRQAAELFLNKSSPFMKVWNDSIADAGLSDQARETYMQLCYISGRSLMPGVSRNVGHFELEIGAQLGDVLAATLLCNIENSESTVDRGASALAKKLVADAAEKPEQWQARIVRAETLFLQCKSSEQLKKPEELATEAFHMTEPGDENPFGVVVDNDDKIRLRRAGDYAMMHIKSPWKILQRIAKAKMIYLEKRTGTPEYKAARELWEDMTEIGADTYGDTEALNECHLLQSLERYSAHWVKLVTQAAMAGNFDACWWIGKYHLEKDGWYPTGGKRRLDHSSGLDWLEAAACHKMKDPNQMGSLYIAIALLCRENDKAKEGFEWLNRGTRQLNIFAKAQPGLVVSLKELETWKEKWSDEDWIKVYARASDHLGEPLMKK